MFMYSKMVLKNEYFLNFYYSFNNGKIKLYNFVVFFLNVGEIGVQYVYFIQVLVEVKLYIIFYINYYFKLVIFKSYYFLFIYICSIDFCLKMEIFVVNKKNSGVI